MHIKKQHQNIIMIAIAIFAMVGFYVLVNYNIDKINSNSDIRPFSELLEMDFADVGDETIQDPNSCGSIKVLEQLQEDSTNPNLAGNWGNYEPNIHKLKILENCWRQYENEYVTFKIRDLNDSLKIRGADQFRIADTNTRSFSVLFPEKNNLSYDQALLVHIGFTGHVFIKTDNFINPNGVIIHRTDTYSPQVMQEKQIFYTIEMPGKDKFIYLPSYSKRISKEILSTIELK